MLGAAEAGDVTATLMLSYLALDEQLPDAMLSELVTYLKRDVEAGSPRAMADLGRFHDLGLGVQKDEAKALAFYRQGAVLGDLNALGFLAQAYELGRGEYREDQEKAITLYMRSLLGGSLSTLALLTDEKTLKRLKMSLDNIISWGSFLSKYRYTGLNEPYRLAKKRTLGITALSGL